jgi:hypothetical protein
MIRFRHLAAFLPLLLAACADDAALYRQTVIGTAVHRPADERPLAPLAYPVLGATLTRSADWAKGHIGEDLVLTRDSWITIEPAVRDACRAYPADERIARLHKLLGLKPAEAADAGSSFVLLTVEKPQAVGPAATAVFRPCPDPDPAKPSCGNTLSGPPGYADWFARNMLSSYILGDDMNATGYPWTRAGYTYDWNAGHDPRRGPQEYVVTKGATVRIRAVVPVGEYCG